MSSTLEDSKPLELTPRAGSEEMVQIPADTLSSILSRLSALESQRDEVSTLQGKLSAISAELSKLQKNTGVSFPRFSELPAELRNMIWRYALTGLPQIHILGDEICTRSMVNAVAQSCKEAQDVLEDLELDYLLIDGQISSGPGMVTDPGMATDDCIPFKYKSYVNLDIDTFWLYNDNEEVHIPLNVTPVCGKCVKKSGPVTRGTLEFGTGTICPRIASEWFFPMRTLAIDADLWTEKGDIDSTGTLDLLWRCKVEKLLIVVGRALCFSPRMVFATPITHIAGNLEKKFLGANSRGESKWFTLEENIQIAMQNFKDQRAVDRKEECESLGIELEDLDDYEHYRICDLSDWKIPTVTFVSARPASRKWVIPTIGI